MVFPRVLQIGSYDMTWNHEMKESLNPAYQVLESTSTCTLMLYVKLQHHSLFKTHSSLDLRERCRPRLRLSDDFLRGVVKPMIVCSGIAKFRCKKTGGTRTSVSDLTCLLVT